MRFCSAFPHIRSSSGLGNQLRLSPFKFYPSIHILKDFSTATALLSNHAGNRKMNLWGVTVYIFQTYLSSLYSHICARLPPNTMDVNRAFLLISERILFLWEFDVNIKLFGCSGESTHLMTGKREPMRDSAGANETSRSPLSSKLPSRS